MISRRTTRGIAAAYAGMFSRTRSYRCYSGARRSETYISSNTLYDFLYDNDFAAWFCNAAQEHRTPRKLQEFIMRLHTGESQFAVTQKWERSARQKLGQEYLRHLAEAIVRADHCGERDQKQRSDLLRLLEIDGYVWQDDELLFSEIDVLDVEEERGVLNDLYSRLLLPGRDIALKHLDLSEEHYVAERWGDCISNARSFLECTLQNVARAHYERATEENFPSSIGDNANEVRRYLCDNHLLESVERDALAKTYAVMSTTGSHPYMAKKDQARLLRQLALTYSHFVMLRYEGAIASP